MKILVASHTYIVDLNREKLRELARLEPGTEVTVVVPKRWKPGGVQKKLIESQPVDEGDFRVVPISNFSQNQQGLLTFGWDLVSLLREFRPDIIQVEQGAKALGYAQFITLNRLLKLKAKNVFFTWWNLPYEVKFPLSVLERYNLTHTDGVVVGNQDGANILRDHDYDGAMTVLPQLGVDETLFCPQNVLDLREELGIPPQEFVVGFVGRFVEEKGLLTLAKALEGLGDRPWRWLLLGRGPLREQLESWAQDQGLTEKLTFVESVPHDQVCRYINLLDTLVLPSETTYQFKTLSSVGWKEQFGHVLIEAMACRVPVIGSDSGEIPHVIGESGLVFAEGNAEELRDCLLRLMENPELAGELAQRGYHRALADYTNRAIAQKQLAFYQQLLTHH
ncbi:hormogonium polysaccharide biosynthesis glycosyltransferase HpsO [Phormidium yuhuli AB48]|uniref:Hormogonium polysaccharide biosynthesis glycosyltransferase HpsO n=1 Tax=Phormidium yuhuli AB48 TaxID=2940671 RepID=A0ABY5APQ0_9CYAN|nr:hormogonium polysaccharide biosynthesis glycosyltransferase HpsO [Phormidium yuhuli]USR90878.1 hormogonium polysaccharide biosynthesis glycosyltransferase HpsO [Phormidium yuhuli AB48]